MSMQADITVTGLNEVPANHLAVFIADQLEMVARLLRAGKGSQEINETLANINKARLNTPETIVSLPYVTVEEQA